MNETGARGSRLSVLEASAMLVGVVVGIGIFKAPPLVAANVSTSAEFIALWIAGGALMIIGALCYAELGSRHPETGGEYHYLSRAYGDLTGFLFGFGRMAVMQSGALAAVAYAFGDYANTILPLGASGAALHAGFAILILTGLQLFGTAISGRSQLALTILTIGALLLVTAAAYAAETPLSASAAPQGTAQSAAGLALVFILLTYGGWNEAAYLSGELHQPRRNMERVLLIGTCTILALYLALNGALLYAFGLDGLRQSKTILEGPVADVFGPTGTLVVALVVCAAAISTMNATIFTGARSILALGRDFAPFAVLGRVNRRSSAPVNALLIQCAIALALIAFAASARDGFQALVEYTAPVFWTFLLLVGLSLFLFRRSEHPAHGGFRVPLYPLPPLIFCATCLYLIWSSLAYTGTGALVGVAIMAVAFPVYWLGRREGGDPARSKGAAD